MSDCPITSMFTIFGLPAPQGSKTIMRGKLVEGSSATGRAAIKEWRATATTQAFGSWRRLGHREPLDGPIAVELQFWLPMPESRPKWIRDKDRWPCHVKPDLDKLCRSTLDALTAGGVIRDDARVQSLRASKIEARDFTGCHVTIRPLDLEDWELNCGIGVVPPCHNR